MRDKLMHYLYSFIFYRKCIIKISYRFIQGNNNKTLNIFL